MVWAAAVKVLGVEEPVGHSSPSPLVRDAPRFKAAGVEVTPAKLFGAIARCSHLYPVGEAAVTPEVCWARALVEHHVEEAGAAFALKPSAAKFKDFVRAHFTGSLAAGLAYVFLEQLGYAWVDHFELRAPPDRRRTSPAPDFLFAVPGAGDIALVEAKGTQTQSAAAFNRTLKAAYGAQLEPHLGKFIHGTHATHGFVVGAWLNPPRSEELASKHPPARLHVHQSVAGAERGPAMTRRPRLTPVAPSISEELSSEHGASIVVGSYARTLSLVFGAQVGGALRAGGAPSPFGYRVVRWLGEEWALPLDVGAALFMIHHGTLLSLLEAVRVGNWEDLQAMLPEFYFAPLDSASRQRRGAVFRDGLAVRPAWAELSAGRERHWP